MDIFEVRRAKLMQAGPQPPVMESSRPGPAPLSDKKLIEVWKRAFPAEAWDAEAGGHPRNGDEDR